VATAPRLAPSRDVSTISARPSPRPPVWSPSQPRRRYAPTRHAPARAHVLHALPTNSLLASPAPPDTSMNRHASDRVHREPILAAHRVFRVPRRALSVLVLRQLVLHARVEYSTATRVWDRVPLVPISVGQLASRARHPAQHALVPRLLALPAQAATSMAIRALDLAPREPLSVARPVNLAHRRALNARPRPQPVPPAPAVT
jgi:hypothetical protein